MVSDVDVSRWVLELLVRDRERERIAKRVLQVAPLSYQDWRLRKTVLLRSIECDVYGASVTETILETLETIEDLDVSQGIATMDSMKAAYCAVATECTVKFLVGLMGRPSEKYLEAVDQIWRGRVAVLEGSEKSELVSTELKQRRQEIEAAVWDLSVAKKLLRMNTRNDALILVAVYVKEAWALTGPPFITLAVRLNMPKKVSDLEGDHVAAVDGANMGDGSELEVQTEDGANVGDGSELEVQTEDGANVVDGSKLEAQMRNETNLGDGSELEAQMVNGANVSYGPELGPQTMSDLVEIDTEFTNRADVHDDDQVCGEVNERALALHSANVELGLSFRPATTTDKEIQRNMGLRDKHLASDRRTRGLVKIRDAEDLATDSSDRKYDSLSTPEVSKVQEALKSSVLELQAVVTDPLPGALHVAETVRSDLAMKSVNNVSRKDLGGTNPSVEKSNEPNQSNNDNLGNLCSSHQNDVPQRSGKEHDANPSVNKGTDIQTDNANVGNPSSSNVARPSLMERNTTARTYEWDDSIDMSNEGTMNNTSRLHLPCPKRHSVSPLKKFEMNRISKRRKVKRWSLLEEDTLRTAVQTYGVGRWKFILQSNPDIFEERTEVDLKDKWRNMTRSGTPCL